jgi:hypothetical protein
VLLISSDELSFILTQSLNIFFEQLATSATSSLTRRIETPTPVCLNSSAQKLHTAPTCTDLVLDLKMYFAAGSCKSTGRDGLSRQNSATSGNDRRHSYHAGCTLEAEYQCEKRRGTFSPAGRLRSLSTAPNLAGIKEL